MANVTPAMEKTLKATRAAQLKAQADDYDRQAQTMVDQAAINRGEDVPGTDSKGRKGFKYSSPRDQKDFESYTSSVSGHLRKTAAQLRRDATKMETEVDE